MKDVSDEKMRKKKLLNDLRKTRRFWKVKEKALDHGAWKTGLGRTL
jgi:hypothetical protein